ncbi:hypothetical protein BS47DRAFT_598054 [Hydnum rufescens UP504]|uniref:Uncharacterized protein n=1 Tax=Hydnum rufescens UP504 TaxID=1448309 RepID=A0A9P6DHT4_9AGAM|nr:hypothetical protein BS47DRAFT_598054 [Hydnum rufescens UP504]
MKSSWRVAFQHLVQHSQTLCWLAPPCSVVCPCTGRIRNCCTTNTIHNSYSKCGLGRNCFAVWLSLRCPGTALTIRCL